MLLGALLLNVRADPVPSSRSPEGWQRAIGTWAWQFPRDHGAHPDFKTEWWYFTGNLEDAAHRPFGYELTIFRQGIQKKPGSKTSQWAVRDIYFGHLAITDIAAQKFYSAERVSRGALGEAFTRTRHMEVKLGPWQIAQDQGNETINLAAQTDTLDLRLQARPSQPLILEGVAGLSQKSKEPGQASFYYSYPRLATAGALTVDGRTYQVVGRSWFDHEFSTSSLAADQVGWDWFCLQLDNREDVMLYVMRRADGSIDPRPRALGCGPMARASACRRAVSPSRHQPLDERRDPRDLSLRLDSFPSLPTRPVSTSNRASSTKNCAWGN